MQLKTLRGMTAIGERFLIEEIRSGWPILGLIENPEFRSIIHWITSLVDSERTNLLVSLREKNESSELVAHLRKLQSTPVGPRHKFHDRKRFLVDLRKSCSTFDFQKCDSESIAAATRIGGFRVLTLISASNRLYNIDCCHTVYDDETGDAAQYSISSAAGIYHGDFWKSSDLVLEKSLEQVSKWLHKSYEMLKEELTFM